jgi:hypothetical protein
MNSYELKTMQIATESEALRIRLVGELTVVNKRMHRRRAHDGAIAFGDRRAGASAVSDASSGHVLRYAAPQLTGR